MCIFPKRNRLLELQHLRLKWLLLQEVKVICTGKGDLIHHYIQEGGGGPAALQL